MEYKERILLVNTYIAISDCCLNPKMTKTRRADCDKVLKENKRAIRFYQKCGFDPDGEEIYSTTVAASEIRMILKR